MVCLEVDNENLLIKAGDMGIVVSRPDARLVGVDQLTEWLRRFTTAVEVLQNAIAVRSKEGQP